MTDKTKPDDQQKGDEGGFDDDDIALLEQLNDERVKKAGRGSEADQPTPEQKLLIDALERNGYDSWYTALLHAGIEETKDAAKAVKYADEVFKKHPKDPSTPAPDDANVLFGGKGKPDEST